VGRVEQIIHPPAQTCRLEEIKKRKKEIFKTSDFLAQIVASRWGYNL
jgi:hypothetical protein